MTKLISYPCGKEGEYIIPDSVTEIGDDAFCGCTGLTSITMSRRIRKIGSSAFKGCTGLTRAEIDANELRCYAFCGGLGL